jgi:hypothetical protein
VPSSPELPPRPPPAAPPHGVRSTKFLHRLGDAETLNSFAGHHNCWPGDIRAAGRLSPAVSGKAAVHRKFAPPKRKQRTTLRNENEITSRERTSEIVEFNCAIARHGNHGMTLVPHNLEIGKALDVGSIELEVIVTLVEIDDNVVAEPPGEAESVAATPTGEAVVAAPGVGAHGEAIAEQCIVPSAAAEGVIAAPSVASHDEGVAVQLVGALPPLRRGFNRLGAVVN